MPKRVRKSKKKSHSTNPHVTTHIPVGRNPRPHTFLPFKSGLVDTTNADMRPVKISVHLWANHTNSSTANTAVLTSADISAVSLGPRAVAFADLFSYYRIVSVRIVGRANSPYVSTATTALVHPGDNQWYFAFPLLPKSTYQPPTTINQFCDFPNLFWGDDRVPIKAHLNRNTLLSGLPYMWLKTTQTGSIPDDEFIQFSHNVWGQNLGANITASVMTEIWDVDIEFAGGMDPSLNPKLEPSYLRKDSFTLVDEKKK